MEFEVGSVVELYVPDWLAVNERIGRRPKGTIKEETDEGILFSTADFPRFENQDDEITKEVWLPKSMVHVVERSEEVG